MFNSDLSVSNKDYNNNSSCQQIVACIGFWTIYTMPQTVEV